jgi:integrase
VYEGADGNRRSADPSRRGALYYGPLSVKSRRSGRGGGGIVPSVTLRSRLMSRTAGFPANASRPRLALRTGRSGSALPAVLRQPAGGSDLAVVGSGVGDQGHCRGPISSVGAEVSRHAAFDQHNLRHAHASWLLAGGADLKGVMDRMGHAQIQTTQKYLHALPDTDQKNLDALTRMTGRSVRDRMS